MQCHWCFCKLDFVNFSQFLFSVLVYPDPSPVTRNRLQAYEELGDDAADMMVYLCPQALLLVVGCLTSRQHASVSQGRVCSIV